MDDKSIPIPVRVRSRKRDDNGDLIGIKNQNPILDLIIFVVEFADGKVDEYNTIKMAEALYCELDEEGFDTHILDEILDHRKSETDINIDKGLSNGNKSPVITTKGWDVKRRWVDNSFDWLLLSQVKEAEPLKMSEYSIIHDIVKEPVFNWWVKKVISKRDRITSKIKTRRMIKPE